ncbi:hypothetical protein NY78_3907 [Desulfovibrio sp. TomC]|nr:hypothetical protein NY78_3907 [Desulfovibrio sp. TomC]
MPSERNPAPGRHFPGWTALGQTKSADFTRPALVCDRNRLVFVPGQKMKKDLVISPAHP